MGRLQIVGAKGNFEYCTNDQLIGCKTGTLRSFRFFYTPTKEASPTKKVPSTRANTLECLINQPSCLRHKERVVKVVDLRFLIDTMRRNYCEKEHLFGLTGIFMIRCYPHLRYGILYDFRVVHYSKMFSFEQCVPSQLTLIKANKREYHSDNAKELTVRAKKKSVIIEMFPELQERSPRVLKERKRIYKGSLLRTPAPSATSTPFLNARSKSSRD